MSTILYTGDLEGARDSLLVFSQRLEEMSANVATLINAIANIAVNLDSVKELAEQTNQENEIMKKTVSDMKEQLESLKVETETEAVMLNEHA